MKLKTTGMNVKKAGIDQIDGRDSLNEEVHMKLKTTGMNPKTSEI